MTNQEFNAQAYLITEAERAKIEALIVEQYELALTQVNDKIGAMIAKARDAGVKPADQYNWFIQYNRLQTLQNEIYDAYTKAGGTIKRLQIEAFDLSFSNQYYRTSFALSWSDPIAFTVLDENLVRYAMTGNLEVWKKIKGNLGSADMYTPVAGTLTALIDDNQVKAIKAIYAQINAGLINGEGFREISKRIATIIGAEYDGMVTGEIYKALRIAHTEGHRAQNMAELARGFQAEAQGVKVLKMWDATLDNAVRPEHAAVDGVRIPLTESWSVGGYPASFPGDPTLPARLSINCRCQSITVTEDYQPQGRRGRNPLTGKNEVFSYKTFGDWAKENGLKANKYGKLYTV